MGARLFKYEESGELKELGAFSDKPGEIEPTALLEDREGGVWIGTAYHGLFHFDGSVFEAVPTTHRQVNSLAEDREGNLWVGTTGGGLNRVRPRAVELEGAEAGLPFETVQSLCQDSTGMIWAVTQNGAIAWRTNGQWRVFNNELISNVEATCVSADPLGRVWIGTRMNGLYCWQNGGFIHWGDPEELEGRTIHTLQSSKSGDLWIGEETPNTVQRLHAGKLVTLRVPPEDLRVIRAMTEDANGTVWVGTSRGVLLRVSDDQLIDETPRVPGSPVSIRCLSATPDGSVWIGYAGGGLGRTKGGHFASIRSEQGLFDDYISHIVADESGWLWFGGNLGIFKVRQRDLDDVAEGVAARVRSIHYGRGEGLPSLQGSFGGAPDVLRSRDGRLWIPMRTALAVINPGRLHENSRPPPVLLHRAMVDDRTVALNNGVVPSPQIMNGSILDLRSDRVPLRLPPARSRRLKGLLATGGRLFPEGIPPAWRGVDVEAHGLVVGPASRACCSPCAGTAPTWRRCGEVTGDLVALTTDITDRAVAHGGPGGRRPLGAQGVTLRITWSTTLAAYPGVKRSPWTSRRK